MVFPIDYRSSQYATIIQQTEQFELVAKVALNHVDELSLRQYEYAFQREIVKVTR